MKTIRKPRKMIFALLSVTLAVLMSLTSLAAAINGTRAALEDKLVTLKCESGIPPQYTIEVGQTDITTVINLNEAFSGDYSIATVSNTGAALNNLHVTGKKAGVATIAYGTHNGVLTVTRYQVIDSANISSYFIKDGGTIQFSEPGSSKPLPVVIATGTDNIKWISLNDGIASIDGNTGLVNAEKIGVTILVGEFTDKWGVDRDVHILVGVGVSLEGLDCNTGCGNKPGDEPENPITTTGPGSVVDGRTLDDSQTGDGQWVEVARNGDYSLIIRKDFVKCYAEQDNTDYWTWYALTVSDNNYSDPGNFLRKEINYWFNAAYNGNINGRQYLAKDARLRDYTVMNDAYSVTGTSGIYPNSITDGFSRPLSYRTGVGNDVAFALSWSEAANFCSMTARYRDDPSYHIDSGPLAIAKYEKLNNLKAIFLRTGGDIQGMMGTIHEESGLYGEVFQNNKAFVHPALWVHQDIFKSQG